MVATEKLFYLKKYSDSQCCWKKYSDFGGGKKNNLIKSFCHKNSDAAVFKGTLFF
jgi:hypothetical protein